MSAADLSIFQTTYGFIYNNKLQERVRRGAAVRDGMDKLRAPGRGYRVGVESKSAGGYTEGVVKEFDEAKARAEHLLRAFPTRKVRVVAIGSDGTKLDQARFVVLRKTPDPAGDVRLCEGCRRFIGWVEQERKAGRLKGVRYAGGCVCKHTTSGGHSDHADCAAIDIFAENQSMERIRDVAMANAEFFNLKYVILYQTIWFPGQGPRPYSGVYHAHDHLSFYGGKYNSAC